MAVNNKKAMERLAEAMSRQGMGDGAVKEVLEYIRKNPGEIVKEAARDDLLTFARYVQPSLEIKPFHRVYYNILNEFAHGRIKKLIVTIPPQSGKALPVGTPVLTTGGWKRHGDLREGDYVFGDDGKPKRVLQNFGKYRWKVMDVKLSHGVSIKASREHRWKVWRDKGDGKGRVPEITETSMLLTGGGGKKPCLEAGAVLDMPWRRLPIDPYVLGLWLGLGKPGEGTVKAGKRGCAIMQAMDKRGVAFTPGEGGEIRVDGLTEKLKREGLLYNKHVPDVYLLADVEQRYSLLRGYMDASGLWDSSSGRCSVRRTCTKATDDMYVLMRTLGIKPTRLYSGEPWHWERHVLSFTAAPGEKVFSDEAKVPKKQPAVNKKRFYIDAVEDAGEEMVNCIQVEGSMYLAGRDLIPTHNSEAASRKLPAFLLGRNPDCKVSIGSYSTAFARDFNRDVQKIMETPEYRGLFPRTMIGSGAGGGALRTADVTEIVGRRGSLRAIGRGGSLTGRTVDISILDDVYKDYAEANSPVVREAAWKWYTTVVRTRLHNMSQELIAYTRWHSDDLVGRLEKVEQVIDIKGKRDLEGIPPGAWVRINFEAIKVTGKTEFDNREVGEVLWPEKHSLQSLLERRKLDKMQFDCLYQGQPGSAEGRLYQPFKTYVDKSDYGTLVAKGNYTDCADEGGDYLCSICYDKLMSRTATDDRGDPLVFLAVTDVVYTDEPVEVTTRSVPMMLNREGTQYAYVESNNGGRAFSAIIEPRTMARIYPFTQTQNKESRIITNAGLVNQHVIMPFGWETRWPRFYEHVTTFLRNFRANEHDDIEDALSGIIDKEITLGKHAGLRRIN